MNALGRLDWIGIALWAVLWLGYVFWAERQAGRRPSMMSLLATYRRRWMHEAYLRDIRIPDVAMISSLAQSATFFTSTTLLILGGLFALLGTIDQSAQVVQSLPFAARTSRDLLEVKALLLTLVFAYAFLRFTWSLRQFNLVHIVVGVYPAHPERRQADDRLIEQASRLNELAGANFTQGLRAYYFSIPLLFWLINPKLLIGGSVVITIASWYMEFRSATVRALSGEADEAGEGGEAVGATGATGATGAVEATEATEASRTSRTSEASEASESGDPAPPRGRDTPSAG